MKLTLLLVTIALVVFAGATTLFAAALLTDEEMSVIRSGCGQQVCSPWFPCNRDGMTANEALECMGSGDGSGTNQHCVSGGTRVCTDSSDPYGCGKLHDQMEFVPDDPENHPNGPGKCKALHTSEDVWAGRNTCSEQ